MLEQISTRIANMLFEASLKAVFLWVLATLAIRMFRKMSVHAQHRVWTVVLLALLTLPVLTTAGPSWSLPSGVWPLSKTADIADVTSAPLLSADSPLRATDDRLGEFRDPMSERPRTRSLNAAETGVSFNHDRIGNLPPADSGTGSTGRSTSTVVISPSPTFFRWSLLFMFASIVWLVGASFMLLRLLIAVDWTLRIRRAARLVTDNSFPLGMNVRESVQIESPVVVGWWRPCILLPNTWREWNEAKREAVFSHELSHLQRRDTQLSLLVELANVFYWFHPVSWWTRRQLNQLAELACDEAAALAVGDRLAYARYLMEIAAANRNRHRLQPGAAMARSSLVGHRVRRLLDFSRPISGRASWPTLATILLAGIPAVIVLGSFRPTTANSNEPTPKTTKAILRPEFLPMVAKAEPVAKANQVANAVAKKQVVEGDSPILTMRGTVLMPDGTVAKEAILDRSAEKGASDVISATINEGQFEIQTTGTKINSPSFLIRTSDWNYQASLELRGEKLRNKCFTTKVVTLEPTKAIQVKVIEDEKSVKGGHVQVMAGSYVYSGLTSNDGIAEINIPQSQDVFLITAWSDDHAIGGYHAGRAPNNDAHGTDFSIAISRGTPVRVRAVDEKQQPVANVPLEIVCVKGGHGEYFVGSNPTSNQTSNANGEALFEWIPEWATERVYINVVEKSAWRKIKDFEPKQSPEGVQQIEVAPRRTNERVMVNGKLTGVTTDASGLLVEFWSFDGEEEHSSDVLYARCDANGHYTTCVLPGSHYCVFVNDPEYVSNIWDGVVALSKETSVQAPELRLIKGVPVNVHVSKGGDQRAVQNAWVQFESPHHYGQGISGRGFWGKTDEHGRVAALAKPGEFKIRIDDGDWSFEKTVTLVDGEPANIEVHRKFASKQTIIGKLVLPANVTAKIDNTIIKIAGMDGESKDEVTVRSNANGDFTAGIIAGRFSILATSPNEEYFGCGIFDVRDGVIEIPMYPTTTYSGRVVDSQDQPISGATVEMMATLVDRHREYPSGTPDFRKQSVELFRDRKVISDKTGNFVIPKTPQKMELTIWTSRPGETKSADYRQKYFEPDEVKSLEIIQLGDAQKNAPSANKPLATIASDTLRDCRLTGIHALVIISGGGDIAEPFIKKNINEPKGSNDIYYYLPRTINGPEAAELPERREFFAAHEWPFPEKNSLFLSALNGDGKELGRLMLNLLDDQTAAKDAAEFIKKHLPLQHDAKEVYAAALSEAKRSNRRVWVRSSQTRCGPCFRLSRWLDEHRELLSKDYVMFKFDDFLDVNGDELSKTLKFDGHGVPCHAILDSDGNELINSVGPLGNIGHPSSKEEINHFRKMLKESARNLSDADIDSLIQSLTPS